MVKNYKKSLISSCYKKDDYYFCNHGNKSVRTFQKSRPYKTYGYCCPNQPKKMSKKCTPGDKIQCTSSSKKPSLPVYMSYWPGQKPSNCARDPEREPRKIIATNAVYTVELGGSLIKARKAKLYESCFWSVSA
jgi:hypothetical protein